MDENEYLFLTASSKVVSELPDLNIWIGVIKQAIEDIVLAMVLEEEGKLPTAEQIEYIDSANSFLFDDNHFIHFDDYIVDYICPNCGINKTLSMIEFRLKHCVCGAEIIDYTIVDSNDINLTELLYIFGIDDVEKFRNKIRNEIQSLKHIKHTRRDKMKIIRQKYSKNKLIV